MFLSNIYNLLLQTLRVKRINSLANPFTIKYIQAITKLTNLQGRTIYYLF
jgi:hypothetical protein